MALVDLYWPKNAFERYECDKRFKFSVRVEDFVKLIGRTEAKDSIEMTSTEEDALLLRLMNGYKREFKIHLIESRSDSSPLPKLDYDVKLVMNKGSFERVLTDVSVVADQVMISSLKEGACLILWQERCRSGNRTAQQEQRRSSRARCKAGLGGKL